MPNQAADSDWVEATAWTSVEATAYRGPGFVQVNRAPYPSDLSQDLINVFVSQRDAGQFLAAAPERVGSAMHLSPGAVIVREVLTNGVTSKLTIMVQGPAGYYPAGGDFFYAVRTADGRTTLPDDFGQLQEGRVGDCARCHADRAQDHFLFGVPESQR